MVELITKRQYNLVKAYFQVMLGHLAELKYVKSDV